MGSQAIRRHGRTGNRLPAQRANRSTNRAGIERNGWPVGPEHVVGGLSRPDGPGWGNGWPFGPVADSDQLSVRGGLQVLGPAQRLPMLLRKRLGRPGGFGVGRPGVGVGRGLAWPVVFRTRTGHRPAQRASHSPSQGRRPWWLPPTRRPAQRANRSPNRASDERNGWVRWAGTCVGAVPGPMGRAGGTAGPLGRLRPATGCPCEVA
jgi:hypothetical protein